jgi:peptidoglycan/LPS O-acetylase OafA/YrhL
MPQLDTLRVLAVLGVLVAHNWHPRRLPGLLGDLDWAGLGVRLFFVLSGFLITGILLDCRASAEKARQSPLQYVKDFYARRFLRIFPIYYLVLLLTILFNVEPARQLWPWFATYTTNIYVTVQNTWVGRLGHFWSLAVEEQFYLVWPWLILYLPKRTLPFLMIMTIPLASAYRLWAYHAFPFDIGAMDFKAGTFTLANLDTLGIGALLALAWRSGLRREVVQRFLSWFVLPIGLVSYVLWLALFSYRLHPAAFFALGDLSAALVFVWLVSAAGLGFSGLVGKLLELRPLLYLGKISYGVYVYHYFAPLVLIPLFAHFHVPYAVPGLTNFVVSSLLTLVVASASWHVIELPINRFKHYFRYGVSAQGLPPPAEGWGIRLG